MSTYKRVKEWNEAAGKYPSDDPLEFKDVLLNQLARIQEELDEAVKAVKENNHIEMLDAACDLDVTVNGYAYLLDVKDYQGAINAVLDNNDSKLYTADDITHAFVRADSLSATTGELHTVVCTINENSGVNMEDMKLEELIEAEAIVSIHRDRDDKVCKPDGFVGVDLGEFL